MSKFPEKLYGKKLEPFYNKVLKHMREDQINYYIELFESIATFYRVIPLNKVFEIFTIYFGINLSESAFLSFCNYVRHKQDEFFFIFAKEEYNDDDTPGTSSEMERLLVHELYAKSPENYYEIIKLKAGKPWFIPTLKQFENYEDELEFARSEQAIAAAEWLKSNIPATINRIDDILDDILLDLHSEFRSFEHCILIITRYCEYTPYEKFDLFMPYYIELNNNTKMAANNGFTPYESELLKKDLGFTSDTLFISTPDRLN